MMFEPIKNAIAYNMVAFMVLFLPKIRFWISEENRPKIKEK